MERSAVSRFVLMGGDHSPPTLRVAPSLSKEGEEEVDLAISGQLSAVSRWVRRRVLDCTESLDGEEELTPDTSCRPLSLE